MNKKGICEVLYTSYGDCVEARRKSLVWPIVVLVAGVALLIVNAFVDNGADSNNLKSTLVLGGGLVAIAGIVLILARLLGEGAPYHKATKSFLCGRTYSFAAEQREQVMQAVKVCDVAALAKMPQSDVQSIVVVTYASKGHEFVALQPFVYEELEYRPIVDVVVKSK